MKLFLAVTFAALAAAPAAAQGMLGDWGGLRTDLADVGVTAQAEITGFGNALLAGEGRKDIAPFGRFDLLVDLSTEKLGLWKGGQVRTHSTIRFGEMRSNFGGALMAQSTPAILPLDGANRFVATSIYLAQSLGPRTTALLGKINTVDLLAADPVLGGWGTKRFQNLAFAAPLSGVVPPAIMGAVLIHRSEPVAWTFMVFDSNDRTRNYFVDGLFEDGVNFSVTPTWSFALDGRPSSLSLTAGFSTERGADLGDVLLPPELEAGTKKGSYNIALAMTHRLVESAAVKGKGLDLYFEAAIADGNPNPVQNSLTFGMVGSGLVPGRPGDRFGFGAFWFDFSDALQEAVSGVANFENEAGLEAWYSLGLSPWLNLSGHIQLADPASGDRPNAVVGGVRANLVF